MTRTSRSKAVERGRDLGSVARKASSLVLLESVVRLHSFSVKEGCVVRVLEWVEGTRTWMRSSFERIPQDYLDMAIAEGVSRGHHRLGFTEPLRFSGGDSGLGK